MKIQKKKSGYAIYHKNKRMTAFVPDKKSINIVYKHFKKIPKKYLKVK